MVLSPADFYDALAEDYHLLFADWGRSLELQGAILDGILRSRRPGRGRLLDCACGIGTQAIGLAGLGWQVHATDLSPASVERAAREAASRGVTLTTGRADMRRLASEVRGEFDAVICCDNSLAHLADEEELRSTVEGMRARLAPQGVALVTLRDYDALRLSRPVFAGQRFHPGPGGMQVAFQVWEWDADGRAYLGHHFLVRERPGGWATHHRTVRFRAFLREEVEAMLRRAGFAGVRWHMPEDTGYHQPIATAARG